MGGVSVELCEQAEQTDKFLERLNDSGIVENQMILGIDIDGGVFYYP